MNQEKAPYNNVQDKDIPFQITSELERFFSLALDLLCIADVHGNFLKVNKAWEEILGYSISELETMKFLDFVHPEDLSATLETLQMLESQEQVLNFVNRYRCKDGSYRYIEWRSQPYGDKIYAAARDITERILAEERLKESQSRFRNLVETMNEGLVLHEMVYDENGKAIDYKILGVNRAFYTQTGISQEITEGILASEFYQSKEPPYIKEYEKCVVNGESFKFITYYSQMDKHFQISVYTPQKDHFATVFEDITDRVKAHEIIYEEKERLRVTLESIGDGVIATDKKGVVTMLNRVAQELTGWGQFEACGKPLADVFNIINEYTEKKCENPVERVLCTGGIIGLANHTALISKDGTVRPIADSAAPIKNQFDEILGVVLVFRDVTEEKKKEKEILHISYHDLLTGLYNRAFFEEELKRLDTERQLPMSIIIGDVNGLKITNDVFGHQEGDVILKEISRILVKACRKEDIIARWGGDEFVILLPNTSENVANNICKRIQKSCQGEKDTAVQLSISLGHATKENAQENILQVLKNAEDWMYRHKLLESKSFRSSIIFSLKKTLFEKSNETEEHAERMAKLCIKLGKEMCLYENELDELKLLAMLHDIGKIAIKDSILVKPGKLSPEEWEEIKRHSEIGYRIAQSAPELAQIADYILSHHERWDGSGYPQGIKGLEIPKLSRIISVVDAFDVMMHARIYKQAMSYEDAVAELDRCAGTQFDPEIVDVFKRILHEESL